MGTAGCNMGCFFCQNWDISKSRQDQVNSRTFRRKMFRDARDSHTAAIRLRLPITSRRSGANM